MFNLMDINKRKKYTLVIFAVFIVIGLIGGAVKQSSSYKTERGCSCSQNTGEIDCNKITSKNTLFFTGIFNMVEEKIGSEVVTCSEGERVDTHSEFRENNINFKVFSVTLFSL